MSLFTAAAISLGVAWAVPLRFRRPALVVLGVGLAGGPIPATALAASGASLSGLARLRRRRRTAEVAAAEVVDLARFLVVGVSAGWSLDRALGEAVGRLTTGLAADVSGLLRRARVDGLGRAFLDAAGPGERLYRLLARSQLGGMPADRALQAFIRDEVERRRGVVTERARRLPVRMVVPLTLLMLPGFVLLVAGPAIVVSARRLFAPFVT